MENYSYNKRKVGLPPGTIFYTGDKADKNVNMELYFFDGREKTYLAQCKRYSQYRAYR